MSKNQTISKNVRLENMLPGWPYRVVQGNETLRPGYTIFAEENGDIFCEQLEGWLRADDIANLAFLSVLVIPYIDKLARTFDYLATRQRAIAFITAI